MNTDKIDKVSRLQEFVLLFDTAWATYKTYFSRLFVINIVPVLAVTILLTVLPFIEGFQDIVEYIQDGDIVSIFVLILGVILLIVGISSLNYIAQIKLLSMEDDALETSISTTSPRLLIDVYTPASKILFAYIWVLILTGLCILTGFIFLIVPGIIVAVWLSFSSFTVITGKAKGFEALRTSKKLVKGIWAQVFLRFVMVIFLGMLVSSAFGMLQNVIQNIFTTGALLEYVLDIAYQLFVTPYFVVYGYELYKDVVRANEVEVAVVPEVSMEGDVR